MESCPVEICQQIFALACTDGGHTGRSLSLVSRFVNAVAEDVRYRSLSVIGSAQIHAVVALLDTRPDVSRQIQHLFLSDYEEQDDRFTETEVDELRAVGGCPRTSSILRRELSLPISRILNSVSRRLRSLTLLRPEWVNLERLPGSCFPLLEEMTIYSHLLVVRDHWRDAAPDPFPSLRRVHLIRYIELFLPRDFTQIAPSLTRLRLSELHHGPRVPFYLAALLGTDAPPWATTDSRPIAPLSLTVRTVIVHLVQVTAASEQASHSFPHLSIGRELLAMARRDQHGRLRVLNNGNTPPSHRLDTALHHWRDRIEGGEGCWQ